MVAFSETVFIKSGEYTLVAKGLPPFEGSEINAPLNTMSHSLHAEIIAPVVPPIVPATKKPQ